MKVKSVSNNIKDLRYKKDNMSQQQLADKVGCSRQTINALEKNRYAPSHLLVLKIAHVLDCEIQDVLQIELENKDE